MSQDPDLADPIAVSTGDVSVEKSFVADEFPVPAIKFVIESTSTDSVDLRLTDDVSESFPMDCVGFHPDYENDNWTAYQDHHVEFVRTLAPEESVTTVYGIRLDETDVEATAFLGEPTVDLVSTGESDGPEAEGVEDIVGENTTDVVRDVLSGESDTVPGMETAEDLDFEDPLTDAADPVATDDPSETSDVEEPLVLDDPLAAADDAETDEVEPRPVADDAVSAVVERVDESAPTAASPSEDEDVAVEQAGIHATDVDPTDESGAAPTNAAAADVTSTATAAASGGVAATLAAEIREGRVDDDDLALLKRELDVGVPNSVDVRIGRLQSRMDDLAAYSDALAEFIDEEGTGEQLIAEFRTEVESVSSSLTTLETALTAAQSDRVDLRDEVDDVATTVTNVERRVETTADELSSLATDVDALAAVADDVEEVATTVDSLDTEMGDVRADVADLDADLAESRAQMEERLDAVREEVAEQIETLRDDLADAAELGEEIDDIQTELVELKQFRDRLGSAFDGN